MAFTVQRMTPKHVAAICMSGALMVSENTTPEVCTSVEGLVLGRGKKINEEDSQKDDANVETASQNPNSQTQNKPQQTIPMNVKSKVIHKPQGEIVNNDRLKAARMRAAEKYRKAEEEEENQPENTQQIQDQDVNNEKIPVQQNVVIPVDEQIPESTTNNIIVNKPIDPEARLMEFCQLNWELDEPFDTDLFLTQWVDLLQALDEEAVEQAKELMKLVPRNRIENSISPGAMKLMLKYPDILKSTLQDLKKPENNQNNSQRQGLGDLENVDEQKDSEDYRVADPQKEDKMIGNDRNPMMGNNPNVRNLLAAQYIQPGEIDSILEFFPDLTTDELNSILEDRDTITADQLSELLFQQRFE
jgi:hypothetical protein